MWKKILKKMALFFLKMSLKSLFNAIDKNNDGKLSKQEIKEFVNTVRSFMLETQEDLYIKKNL